MLWSATFVGSELHSFVLTATVIRFSYWYRPGAKVPGNESSWEQNFQRAKVPCNFRSRERKFQGAKVPGSESSTYGTFALGSERAKVRGNESSIIHSNPVPIGKQTDPQLLIQFILHTSKLVVIHKLIVKTLHVEYGATVK